MKIVAVLLASGAFTSAMLAAEPAATTTNSIGMDFVLIKPGQMVVGKYEAMYPTPSGLKQGAVDIGRGGGGGRGNAGNPTVTQMFTDGDRDGDKKLSKVEFSTLAGTWYDKVDPDKVGKVAQADFVQRIAPVIAPPAPGGAVPAAPAAGANPAARGGGRGGAGAAAAGQIFNAVDADKDGSVTRAEFQSTFDKWFAAWDTTASGALAEDRIVPAYTASLAAAQPPAPAGRGGGATLTPEQYQLAADRAAKEAMPGFTVKIAKAYYIGKFEVTQAQWKAVMGRNPSAFQAGRVDDDPDKHPVDSVTWDDAQAFVKKLNEMEKTKAYRLPTEFEWEYAARAGNTDDITTAEAADQGWFRGHNHRTTYAVGLKKPNAWGVYDMIGNVWEWVQDFDNLKFFADPTPPRTGKYHVLKGAGFTSHEKNATYMVHGGGPGTPFETGFRIVRDAN